VTLQACDRCHAALLLLAPTTVGLLCAACWSAMGEPGPPLVSDVERYNVEQANRRRMEKHGGALRHLARARQ